MRKPAHCIERVNRIAHAAAGSRTRLIERGVGMTHGNGHAQMFGHEEQRVDSFDLRRQRQKANGIPGGAHPSLE